MPAIFITLLKINLVLILFAAAYYLVLRRLTFYTINRLFLVFGITFSTVYPVINLTDFFHNQREISPKVAALVPQLNQKVNELVPSNFIAIHWQSISILFYLGVALMGLRLVVQFVSLYIMHKRSKPGAVNNYPVRILSETVSPFSFWQTVYINPALHEESELQTILAHEQIHVKQWHSLDIILAELSVVFYWFNPGVWLMKKAVKENLEFITDQKILNKGIDRKTYQYSLLDVGNLTPAVKIVNNFNLSDLKKRIKMMNVKRSSRLTLTRYLLVTPVLLITTLAFTVSKKDIKKHLKPLQEVLISNHVIDQAMPIIPKVEHRLPKKKVERSIVVKKPDSSGKVFQFLKTIFIATDSVSSEIDGKTHKLLTKIVIKHANIGDSVLQPIRFVRGINLSDRQKLEIVSKNQELSNQEDGKTTEQVVIVRGFKSAAGVKQEFAGQQDPRLVPKGAKPATDTAAFDNANFYINGKRVTAEDLKNIKTEEIKTVTIQKRKTDEEVVVIGHGKKSNPN